MGAGHVPGLVLKPQADELPALLEDARFGVPPYFGPKGWVALELTAAPVDQEEVDALLETSYRRVALRRMLAAIDGTA